MILRLGIAAGVLALLAAAPVPVMSVGDVIAGHEALDGKTVRVRGWLYAACYRFGCAIRARNERLAVQLSIGESSTFDRALEAANAVGKEIVVEGRVDRTCFDHSKDPGTTVKDIVICTDRAPQLADPRLIDVLPSSARDQ